MALTLTYDPQLSRVRISADVPAGATATVDVERSTDGVTWTVVRGGKGVEATAGAVVDLNDFEFPDGVEITYRLRRFDGTGTEIGTDPSNTITVNLDAIWLKSVPLPFLNRKVDLTGLEPEFARPARHGIYQIIGRSYPVVSTDVRGSRSYTVGVIVPDPSERDNFDLMLSTGDVLFVHVPAAETDCPVTTMYAIPEDVSYVRFSPALQSYVFTLGLTEVAAPGPDIVGATITWQSVINSFATWADVITAETSWYTLNQLIGSPTDVIVP